MEQIPAEQIKTTFDKKQFAINVNMALMLAHVADGYLARAEQNLRDAGKWRLDIKKQMNKAILELQKVTTFTDASLLHSEAYFYADVHFIDKLTSLLITHVQDDEAQSLLLDYINNGLKEQKEYPIYTMQLKEMLRIANDQIAEQEKLIEKLRARVDQLDEFIDANKG